MKDERLEIYYLASDRVNFNSHIHCRMGSFSSPHPKTHPAETPENIDTMLCKHLIAAQFTACLSQNILILAAIKAYGEAQMIGLEIFASGFVESFLG